MRYHSGEAVDDGPRLAKALLGVVEARTRPRFSMLLHPDCWEWNVDLGEWLPEVTRFTHSPGVQGVGWDPKRKVIDLTAAEAYYRNKGHLVLHNKDPRLQGVLDGGVFMARTACTNRKWAYSWVWERFEKVKNQIIWNYDEELRIKVSKHLVSTGIIPPMSLGLKTAEMRVLAQKVRRLSEKTAQGNKSPSLSYRLKGAEALLKAWKEDFEKHKNPTGYKAAQDAAKEAAEFKALQELEAVEEAKAEAKQAKAEAHQAKAELSDAMKLIQKLSARLDAVEAKPTTPKTGKNK